MSKKSNKSAPPPPWNVQFRPTLERILFIVAIIGVLTTVHLYIQQGIGFNRGCMGFSDPSTVDATFDCEAVTTSDASKLFGVSNAIWGILYYLVVAALCAGVAFMAEKRPLFKLGRLAVVSFGLLYSMYLSYVAYFVIGELCALCLTSASVTVVLFALLMVERFKEPERSRRRGRVDMNAAMKLYGGVVAALVILVVSDFAYFGSLEDEVGTAETELTLSALAMRQVNVDTDCKFDEERPVFSNIDMLLQDGDGVVGNPEAPVTIVEYFDPNCPHCKTAYPIIHHLVEKYPEDLRVIYKPVAIVAQHSVPQVAALHAAAEEGKFVEMAELQFINQKPRTGNSMNELRSFANRIGMDGKVMEERIRDGEFRSIMQKQNDVFRGMGFSSVPMILLNGRVVASSSRNVGCFSHFIEEAAQANTSTATAETATGE